MVHAIPAAAESIQRSSVQRMYLKLNVSVVTSMDIYQRIAQRSPEDQMAKVPVRDQRVRTRVTTGTKAKERRVKVKVSPKASQKAKRAMVKRASSTR